MAPPEMFTLSAVVMLRASAPWFWLIAGACTGVYLFYRGFQLLQRKRLIMNTPASKIRSAAMGLVELSGQATGPYTMTAPITGVPCYYYRTLVWQWKQQGKSSGWQRVAEESLHVPFFLEDNTGRVLVDPRGAELDIHRDFHDEFSTSIFSSQLAIPANITNFLLMHGVSTDKKIKIDEYCIKPKNALFILGTVTHNPGIEVSATPVRSTTSEHGFAVHTPSSLGGGLLGTLGAVDVGSEASFTYNREAGAAVQAPAPSHPVSPEQQAKLAEVLTKAGISNPAAWAAAGITHPAPAATTAATSGGAAAAAAPALTNFDLHPSTVLMKGTHDPAFLISWRSQCEVVQSLDWKSTLMIWGGPLLTLFCVYILAGEFGWL